MKMFVSLLGFMASFLLHLKLCTDSATQRDGRDAEIGITTLDSTTPLILQDEKSS
jgi:hypothetical protein